MITCNQILTPLSGPQRFSFNFHEFDECWNLHKKWTWHFIKASPVLGDVFVSEILLSLQNAGDLSPADVFKMHFMSTEDANAEFEGGQ